MSAAKKVKTVLAHHWLMSMRGGEKTLAAIAEIFPGAPIHSLAGRPEKLSDDLRRHPLHFSFLQGLPGSPRYFRAYLPFFPSAVRSIRVPDCDLLLTSDANVIKGIRKPERAVHVCYCHSPARYLWGMEEVYLQAMPRVLRPLIRRQFARLRDFDLESVAGVDEFVCNSRSVADRIRKHYGREPGAIIPPPVDTHLCKPHPRREDYFLVVSELTPYKRIDLAVQACTRLKKSLVVIGTGSEIARLKAMAGAQIVFLGWQSDETVRAYMSKARAFLFPGEEDFGIAPVEAMAAGAPVIAYGAGGVLDTVVDGQTGVYFSEQSIDSLCEAIESLEKSHEKFDPATLAAHAAQFAREEFQKKLRAFLGNKLDLTA